MFEALPGTDESTVTPPDGDADESTPPGAARLTLIQAIKPDRLSKRFDLAPDGTLTKTPGGNLVEGTATVVQVAGAADLAALLSTLKPDQALVHGIPTDGAQSARVVASCVLTKKQQQRPQETVIARTREYFEFPHGPAVMMLDYDPPPNGAALDREALLHALYQACPALERAPHVWLPSASSCIARTDTGEWVRELAGQRVYALVADGTDIPRAGAALVDRLWVAGRGYIHVSKSGALLPRTLVDEAVWQPERLDFAGGAACGEGLEQRRGAPGVYGDAGYLDTATALPDDRALGLAARQLRAQAKATKGIKREQAAARELWVDAHVEQERRAGRCPDAAAEVDLRAGLKRLLTRQHLPLDFRLKLDNGDERTVAELLAAPDVYDGRRCRDPLEPEYGNDPRIALISLKAKQPGIYSHAHGGIKYTLDTPRARECGEPPAPVDLSRVDADYGSGNLNEFRGTDSANATLFLNLHGENVRYCAPWNCWLVWTGSHWREDDCLEINRLVADVPRSLYRAAGNEYDSARRECLAVLAGKLENSVKQNNMLIAARWRCVVHHRDLDRGHFLLNAANGTIDLTDGTLRPHQRADLLTHDIEIAYDPNATAPTWHRFLADVFAGDEDLIEFARRAIGYSLTADVREHVIFIVYGCGANGKSTFLNVLRALLGSLALQAAPDLLMADRNRRHPTEQADLYARRLAVCQETGDGRRFNEELVKQLTGGDAIRARRMHENFWEFNPTHKLWLSTNHRPEIRGTDHAIWRRIRLIPFNQVFHEPGQGLPVRDPHMEDRLMAELPGILAWAVQGCLAWQRHGLGAAAAVDRATAQYRADMDVLGAFFADRCMIGKRYEVQASMLYAEYGAWCEQAGERPETQRRFGLRLRERGLAHEERRSRTFYMGIGLRAEGTEPESNIKPLHLVSKASVAAPAEEDSDVAYVDEL